MGMGWKRWGGSVKRVEACCVSEGTDSCERHGVCFMTGSTVDGLLSSQDRNTSVPSKSGRFGFNCYETNEWRKENIDFGDFHRKSKTSSTSG